MKKKILAVIMATTLTLSTSSTVQAKSVMVSFDKVTESFLAKHKSDTVYAYCYGTRVSKKGNGKDTDGYYIKYSKGKVGVKFTSIFRYSSHAKSVDDIADRIDLVGWNKPIVK